MVSQKSSYKNALEIIIVSVILLASYDFFLKLTGISAVLLESNLQSNLARISRYLNAPKVDTVLVGSSMTGRLLPSYFTQQGMEVVNLGLDGCHAQIGLDIVLLRRNLPKLILVESSAILNDPNTTANSNEQLLRHAYQSTTFNMGKVISSLRPENRPLSIMYWWIKKLTGSKPGAVVHFAQDSTPYDSQTASEQKPLLNREPNATSIKQFEGILFKLKERGLVVCFLAVPHSDGWGVPQSGWIRRISTDLGIPILEPGVELAKKTKILHFTDGVHLDVEGARQIAIETVKELKELTVQPK
jgi:hypothetical protein